MSPARRSRGSTSEPAIGLRRAYDPPRPGDGHRVLVDRLWPRGVKRDDLALDEWCKDVAPSTELRRWFGHDPARWDEFTDRYRAELADHPDVERLARLAGQGPLTLVYGAADTEHNQAVVLRQVLIDAISRTPGDQQE